MLNLWLNGRLAAAVGSDLSCEVYRRTLYQPYEIHAQRNSSEVISGITTKINLTVVSLNSLLQLITSAVVAVGLLTGLMLIDAPVAFASAALFGSAYGLLTIANRRELRRNGQKIADASSQQVKALQEGLGAIRDVLLDGSQPTYLKLYRQADRPQRLLQAKNNFLGRFPRFAFEALGMVAIALLGWLLVLQRGSGPAVIPLLGAMALGAQRLLPALQQIYSGWAILKGYNAAMQAVLAMLNQPLPPLINASKPHLLREQIRLEGVHFHYESEQPDVLMGLDLDIRVGERIGFLGSTGSGKSTTVDLLLGLLKPSAGKVIVDGADLHDPDHPERLLSWRASIAHVPQSIYLSDSSIAENIAFGIPHQNIDLELVKKAASQAQIATLLNLALMRMTRLSGSEAFPLEDNVSALVLLGHCIGRRILVFDEATSARCQDRAICHECRQCFKRITHCDHDCPPP